MTGFLRRSPLLFVLLAGAVLLAAGCSSSGAALKADNVQLAAAPSPAKANQPVKLLVQLPEGPASAGASVDLQIDKQGQKSRLLKTDKEQTGFAVSYTFPAAGTYAVTTHISTDAGHYSFKKELKVE